MVTSVMEQSVSNNPVRQHLHDILYRGVAPDIFFGERARELHRRIGANADAVNAAGLGAFAGSLQNSAVAELTLSIAKLFERSNARNKLRSIPAALDLLSKRPEDLPPLQEGVAGADLRLMNVNAGLLDGKTGIAYTQALATLLTAACPDPNKAANCELSTALDGLRARRDKAVAHNEAIELGSLPSVTWRDAERLLSFAKNALGALSLTFLGTAFTDDDGNFITAGEAHVAADQFERLLRMARVIAS